MSCIKTLWNNSTWLTPTWPPPLDPACPWLDVALLPFLSPATFCCEAVWAWSRPAQTDTIPFSRTSVQLLESALYSINTFIQVGMRSWPRISPFSLNQIHRPCRSASCDLAAVGSESGISAVCSSDRINICGMCHTLSRSLPRPGDRVSAVCPHWLDSALASVPCFRAPAAWCVVAAGRGR